MTGKKAVLVGASGLVGGELLKLLLASSYYEKVTIISRKLIPLSHPKLSQKVLDFKYLMGSQICFPSEDVFCCLGTTIKKAGSQDAFRLVDYEYPLALAKWALTQKSMRFSVVSAMGANPKSSIFYNRIKGELELELMRLEFPSMDIFRPSLLLGARPEPRFGEKVGALFFSIFKPILIGSLRKYRPIETATVARAIFNAAQMDSLGSHIYESDAIAELGLKG